jgi:hypothetical protein
MIAHRFPISEFNNSSKCGLLLDSGNLITWERKSSQELTCTKQKTEKATNMHAMTRVPSHNRHYTRRALSKMFSPRNTPRGKMLLKLLYSVNNSSNNS